MNISSIPQTWYHPNMEERLSNGRFTSDGAKKFGFKKGNQLGENTAGANHGQWKGGYKMYPSRNTTYRAIKVGSKYILEHRVIIAKHLGRALLKSEAVHHIDGNGLNNSLNNLELLSWGEHKRKHLGSYIYGKDFTCSCGNTKHFAKGMCNRCYSREYARIKFNYKRRII